MTHATNQELKDLCKKKTRRQISRVVCWLCWGIGIFLGEMHRHMSLEEEQKTTSLAKAKQVFCSSK